MISVVVPVLDDIRWLEEQLRAVAAQECPEPWEVVVADNGSTDGSAEWARAWAAANPRFRVVDASGRRGAAAARNAGVAAARGELLAFCDSDDVVYAGWLAACVRALDRSDLVAGSFDFWTLNGSPSSPAAPAATHQLGFLPAGLGANLAVRRNAFEDVGGFSEEIWPGEDIELCWRLQLRGYRFGYASDAVVARRERSRFTRVFDQARQYGHCGPVLFRRYRADGARRDVRGAVRAWAWLVLSAYSLLLPSRRNAWARTAGVRLGRLEASFHHLTFFP